MRSISKLSLFEWLLTQRNNAEYILGFSDADGLTLSEYYQLTEFKVPPDFNLGVNHLYGSEELKKVLSEMYHCEPNNIVITSGCTEANFLVFFALLNRGDEVIVEQPGYQPLFVTPEVLGARLVFWPRLFNNGFKLDVNGLHSLVTPQSRLVVFTNLHNPSGVLTDIVTVKAVSEIASSKGLYVLVDETFLDGAFNTPQSAFGLPNTIITSGISKVYGLGGLRVGWIIAPEEIATLCQEAKAHVTAGVSALSEVFSAQFLSIAKSDYLRRLHRHSEENLQILSKWFSDNQELVEWVKPDGGLFCFPRYKIPVSSLDLCRRLISDVRVMVDPGFFFNMEGFFRLGFICEQEALAGGLSVLSKGLGLIKASSSIVNTPS
ncbi:MAG: aminotransferase class I/II-fold pyridoxal phosphate-dependent enzyme [Candidatus Thermoplasmatota archaeon]